MRLPTSNDLVNFNYLLAVIYNLNVDGWCTIKAVNETCAKKTFNAQIIDYRKIMDLAEYCDLIVTKKGMVSLTTKGTEFLELNIQSFLAPNPKQKSFLADNSVFYGRYRPQARRIFNSFVSDHDEMTYKYVRSDEYEIPMKDKVILHVFEYLGIVTKRDFGFSVEPQFLKHVREIRAEKSGMTQEELELNLDAKRDRGFKAEELIVEYEQRRLRELGLNAEADRVKRISVLEPYVGYDIRSFIGQGPSGEYDKFIEVKSSQKSAIEFFWTKNEIKAAREKDDSYWIYFLAEFKDSCTLKDIKPLLIRNPSEAILNNKDFECEPTLFKITESGDRKFKKLDDETRGRLVVLS